MPHIIKSKNNKHDYEITLDLTRTEGFLWWENKIHYKRTFVGDCTVWRDKETGCRAGSGLERQLSSIIWKHKYDNNID